MLGRELRVHDGEGLPGGEDLGAEPLPTAEHLRGWDDLLEDTEPAPAHAAPRLRFEPRWRRHVRGVAVGIVLAVPAMLIAHALVGKPSGSTRSQPVPKVAGAAAPAIVADGPAAVARHRSFSPPMLDDATRHEGPSRAYAPTREAASAQAAMAAGAPSPASQPAAAERGSASAGLQFGFER